MAAEAEHADVPADPEDQPEEVPADEAPSTTGRCPGSVKWCVTQPLSRSYMPKSVSAP